eukprot:UN05799
MDPQNIQQKTNLLLKVSSPDFWAKNYMVHPKAHRIASWVWVHGEYISEIESMMQLTDKQDLLSRFAPLAVVLSAHSEAEELTMFKFIRENSKNFDSNDLSLIDGLVADHLVIHGLEDKILASINNGEGELGDAVKDWMRQWQKEINVHFEKENQNIVRLWLNMDNALHRTYTGYLDLHYYLHIFKSALYVLRCEIRKVTG